MSETDAQPPYPEVDCPLEGYSVKIERPETITRTIRNSDIGVFSLSFDNNGRLVITTLNEQDPGKHIIEAKQTPCGIIVSKEGAPILELSNGITGVVRVSGDGKVEAIQQVSGGVGSQVVTATGESKISGVSQKIS